MTILEQPKQLAITFDERFIERYAGSLIQDTTIALVELIANAWDAGATEVDITWADPEYDRCFTISDNGHGMSANQFRRRFCAMEYNRTRAQGRDVEFPLGVGLKRVAFGKNGKGRLAAFRFSESFQVTTAAKGERNRFLVNKGHGASPLDVTHLATESSEDHGTTIQAESSSKIDLSTEKAREVVGLRFLADPNFTVRIDNAVVDFSDIPDDYQEKVEINVSQVGTITLYVIDTQKTDRTTRQHGIAWWVERRLVGDVTWKGSGQESVLDGRTRAAKRLTFIVVADVLDDGESVLPDWSGFNPKAPNWEVVNEDVQREIRKRLLDLTSEEREAVKREIGSANRRSVKKMGPGSRERWHKFIDAILESCPSISPKQIGELAGILGKLELATSKYGILEQLHQLPVGDFDNLNVILEKWSVDTAKSVLDELEWRLLLIEELRARTSDESTLEVQELQPLMEQCLWMFGPEYDIIDYTSNEGMTRVIGMLTGNSLAKGSRNRPDFVITPGGTAGFYSYPRYDEKTGEAVGGVGRLVIVELKKPGPPVGGAEKQQPWKYIKELYQKGSLKKGRDPVQAWILGSTIAPNEEGTDTKADETVRLTPMLYTTLLDRAHGRTFQLHEAVQSAPFLDLPTTSFAEPSSQEELDLRPPAIGPRT